MGRGFESHPDHRYKLVSIDLTGFFVTLCRQSVAKQKNTQEMNLGHLNAYFIGFIINRIIRDLTGLSYALGSVEYLALSSKLIIS